MADGFFGRLGPVLSGAGASLAATGDLSQIGTTIPRFQALRQRQQALAGQEQLRGLQVQAAQQRLAEQTRVREQEQLALKAAENRTGLFGGLPEGATLTGGQALALRGKLAERALLPPQASPFEEGRLEIARAKEAREEKAAEDKAATDRAFASLFGVGGGVQPAGGFQAVPPGTDPRVAQAALGVQPGEEFSAPSTAQAVPKGAIFRNLTPEQAQSVGVLAADRSTRADAVKMAARFRKENRKELKATQKEALRTGQQAAAATIVTQDIDRALKIVKDNPTLTTGAIGQFLSNLGGTDARDVNELLQSVRANASFDALQQMRAASPTGGALGSVSERELGLLGATIGSLEQSQSVGQFQNNLRRVKNTYLDIVHGPGNGPKRERVDFGTDRPIELPQGVTEADVQATMQRHGMTREQVLQRIQAGNQ